MSWFLSPLFLRRGEKGEESTNTQKKIESSDSSNEFTRLKKKKEKFHAENFFSPSAEFSAPNVSASACAMI